MTQPGMHTVSGDEMVAMVEVVVGKAGRREEAWER